MVLEQQEVVKDPALATAIGFYKSSNVGINWIKKNSNALREHYFHLS